MPLVWKFMHDDFFFFFTKKKCLLEKVMVNFLFDFFRIGNEAWPNAPSLED